MARSLNKVTLIGNLTRDPELRYTPQGTAVCTLGLATNRQWTTDSGEKKEDVEFHKLVAWSKLAEICAQLLAKGRKIYVEGRLQTRRWKGQDEVERTTTEIVISEMIILDPKGAAGSTEEFNVPEDGLGDMPAPPDESSSKKPKKVASKKDSKKEEKNSDDSIGEDIPF